jgi:hypothetical protein
MSDKHLAEAPWKALVTKQGLKDIGLQKALAAYAKVDAAKDPARALALLDEIGELSFKLKKTVGAKPDAVDHLDEMIKESKRVRVGVELKLKSAEKAAKTAADQAAADKGDHGDDEELAAFKKDLKKETVSALAKVRQRAPGPLAPGEEPKPQLKFMACLGGNHGAAVIIARRVGSSTKPLLLEIIGASTGKFFLGECLFEHNAFTFVLEVVPGGLAKKLAAALLAQAGTKYKVRVRSIDGATTLDSDTDSDEGAQAPSDAGTSAGAATAAATAEASPTPGNEPAKAPSLVALQQTRLAWDKTRKTIQSELSKLEDSIRSACAADEEVGVESLDVGALNRILERLDTRLIDKLDDALNAQDPAERARINQEAKGLVDEYLAFVNEDALMADIDDSGFVPVAVRKTATATLTLLASKL